MKKVVQRTRNKNYYRVLHVPIWLWVFWVLPGPLTYHLFTRGPGRANWIWLAVVFAVCAWRGLAGRLPGVERQPYIIYFGEDRPNLGYRVVCYTAAWIDLLVPYVLNFLGLLIATLTGAWRMRWLYSHVYWVLALLVVLATVFNLTPRARRGTLQEGAERAWFYVAIWTVVPTQVVAWAMWRLGAALGWASHPLMLARLSAFLLATALLFTLGAAGILPRTARYYAPQPERGPLEPLPD